MTLGPDLLSQHSEAAPGPHLLLSVADTGLGIAPELQSRIFDAYNRLLYIHFESVHYSYQGRRPDPGCNDYLTSKWLGLIRPLLAAFDRPLTVRDF